MPDYFTLVALVVTGAIGIASLFNEGRYFLSSRGKFIFILTVVVILGISGYFTFKQYDLWQDDPLTRFLLPPYQSINYFALYSLTHFFASHLISLAWALLLFFTMRILNRKFEERFFEKEELYLATTAIFLTGYPGWLVYLAALILIYLILHSSYFMLQRQAARLPLYHLWAPVAFFVILLNEYWLSTTHWWPLLSL